MHVNPRYGVKLFWVGVALYVLALAISLALSAPPSGNTQVVEIQFGGAQIPTTAVTLLRNLLLVLGMILGFFGAIVALHGESGRRVERVSRVEMADCGNCKASIPADATRCPTCGAEFEETL